METLSFQAPAALKKRLEHFAKEMDRSKAYLIRQALEEYLEDLEDYIEAKRYKKTYDPKENLSFDEVKRRLELE